MATAFKKLNRQKEAVDRHIRGEDDADYDATKPPTKQLKQPKEEERVVSDEDSDLDLAKIPHHKEVSL